MKLYKFLLSFVFFCSLLQVVSAYDFEYTGNRTSGYYVVDCNRITQVEIDRQPSICLDCYNGGIDGQFCSGYWTGDLYTIKEGYREDFTYYAEYPIFGAWDINHISDFREKCFVGDCNMANIRHVLCVHANNTLRDEYYDCDKWVAPYEQPISTSYCVNSKWYSVYKTSSNHDIIGDRNCTSMTTVNFYYMYNDWEGYEGYSADWRPRWEQLANEVNNKFNEYNINLSFNFYEIDLDSMDWTLPAGTIRYVFPWYEEEGDIHIAILAGKLHPGNYGVSCGGSPNPCEASSQGAPSRLMRIPDYFETDYKAGHGFWTLIHEFSHALGCPHTGNPGSLAAHLYRYDYMSYGNTYDFYYECKIALWLLGQYQEELPIIVVPTYAIMLMKYTGSFTFNQGGKLSLRI